MGLDLESTMNSVRYTHDHRLLVLTCMELAWLKAGSAERSLQNRTRTKLLPPPRARNPRRDGAKGRSRGGCRARSLHFWLSLCLTRPLCLPSLPVLAPCPPCLSSATDREPPGAMESRWAVGCVCALWVLTAAEGGGSCSYRSLHAHALAVHTHRCVCVCVCVCMHFAPPPI